jgi:DUF2075 family protein
LGQWRNALERAGDPGGWTVHAPQTVLDEFFDGRNFPARRAAHDSLELTRELRFHFAADLDEWVDGLLADDRAWPESERAERNREAAARGRELVARLEKQGYHLRMTGDLDVARGYLRDRYVEAPDARFGLMASSRDKVLPEWDIPNDWHSTQHLNLGPWYGEDESDPRSCRRLIQCVTEFGAQGLELDGVLLAWGTDLLRADVGAGEGWSNARAKGHARGTHVKDPFQLRLNAYRVLLTRGRDGTVMFVPPLAELDATAAWLQGFGVKVLS